MKKYKAQMRTRIGKPFLNPSTIVESDLFDDLNEFFTTDQYFDEEPIFNPQINVF